MSKYLLGIDIGTGGCKATVLDVEGNFIADGYTEYPSHHPHFGWVEQDPTDWFCAMKNSLKSRFCFPLRLGIRFASIIIGV